MDKKTIILSIIALIISATVGYLIYSYHTQIITLFTPMGTQGSGILSTLQGIVTKVQTTWASIPQAIQGLMIAGIPTLFMLFFAWTKNRAMQKLQQTEQQAESKILNLNTQMQQTQLNSGETIGRLEDKITQLTDQNRTLQASLPNDDLLQEAQKLVLAKDRELDNLRSAYDELFSKVEEYKLKERVVIK